MDDTKDGEGLVTVDAVHQFAYCPRRAYIMHVERQMAQNAFTEDGRRVHRRVDRVDQVLDAPDRDASGTGDDPPMIARSVSLSSQELGITGKLDLVSTDGDEAVPVETKRGSVPDVAGGIWEPERVQLMAQALLLRSAGWRCDHGFIYFAGSRRKVELRFDADLEARTLDMIANTRAQRLDARIPDPLEDSPKCSGCSVAGICLPDETHALRHVPADPIAPTVRRLYPSRGEASPLYVQTQGARIGTRRGMLVVTLRDEALGEFRLIDIDHVVLCGSVQVSAQALHLLCEAGIPVCHLSIGHWFYGITAGFTLRNAYDRAAQFKAASDPARCLGFAQSIVAAKVSNQRTLLMRNAAPRPTPTIDLLARAYAAVGEATDRPQLLGVEGNAARAYFATFSSMLKAEDIATRFDAEGRARRPPPDPLNACLSFGYALLAREATVAIAAVGLDPFWGLYHQPRHGRPALALDLMEEFRPLIVDSTVITAFNTGMLRLDDFEIGASGCLLRDAARRRFIKGYEARMDQLATHPLLGYRVSWRTMLRLQARLLARWLRGDIPDYRGITTR
jgi:CRISPR-associated protein Cas1